MEGGREGERMEGGREGGGGREDDIFNNSIYFLCIHIHVAIHVHIYT